MDFVTSAEVKTDSMHIHELFNYLSSVLKKDDSGLKEWFFARGFILKNISRAGPIPIYLIYYLDHTQLWTPWAREARGTILYFSNQSHQWEILKYNFLRGAEALSNFHFKSGIESTENLSNSNFGVFDKNQQAVMKLLLNPAANLNGCLSMKVDGMLVCFTLYTGEHANVIKSNIMAGDNEFAKQLIRSAAETSYPFVPVISTQKTLDISDERCLSYIVTALICSMGILSYEHMCLLIQKKKLTPLQVFQKYGMWELLRRLNKFVKGVPSSPSLTLSCEAVCPQRTCAWGRVHQELAISYPDAIMNVLSYSSASMKTLPHFMFSDLIHEIGFEEPLFWHVGVTQQVCDMLKDLSAVIMGGITETDYLTKYKPSNKFIPSILHLDFEGFVFWANLGNENCDYHKLKTLEYYITHKPKCVAHMLDIAMHTLAFPSATLVRRIFMSYRRKLWQLYHEFRIILGYDPTNTIVHDQLVTGLKVSAQKAYNNPKLPIEKKLLMLIQSDGWKHVCQTNFCKVFTDETKYLDWDKKLFSLVQDIISGLAPWDSANKVQCIKNMVAQPSPLLEQFYLLVLDSQPSQINRLVEFTQFWVFGCPTSTDIDVIVLAKNRKDVYKNAEIDTVPLKNYLAKLGYDVLTRKIDVNIVWIEDGKLILSQKGCIATQNMLMSTYHLHNQQYRCPFNSLVSLDMNEQVRSASKFILDNLQDLIGKELYHRQFRAEKSTAYEGQWRRVHFAIKVIEHIQKFDTVLWYDAMKSLTMKIIQLVLLEKDIQEYTKSGLAKKFDGFFSGHQQGALWFLMRGKQGTYNADTLQLLKDEFVRIAGSIVTKDLQWQNVPMSVNPNPTKLSDNLYNEFTWSPLELTPQFESEFTNLCQYAANIGNFFPIPCRNISQLPRTVQSHVVAIDQRSDEWKKQLAYYTCGNNTGIHDCNSSDWVRFYYHLIRGCIVEIMAMNNCDFSVIFPGQKITKVNVGLLVQEVGKKGSPGCAPDLLLILDDKEVVPVEIKCLHSPKADNHDFRRGVSLAHRQLESVVEIIGDKNVCHRGIILIVHIHNNVFDVQATMVLVR